MPKINHAFKEITCKIVYYGPGAGGKTTNLIYVHGNVPGKHRGELVSLATEQDRTLFFDFLPLDIGDVKGFKTKFQLYTVPGQVFYNQTRKLVLRGVDGIVFVGDSGANRFQDTIDSFNNLADNLRDEGLDLDNIPFVLQWNKRDLPDAVPVEKLEKAINPDGRYPSFEAIATDGTGCRETLREAASLILKKLNATANIVSDEQVVTERLGVAGGPGGPGRPAGMQRIGPDIEAAQQSKFYWRGMGAGTGNVAVATTKSDQGDVDYKLSSSHRIFGLFKRELSRKMRYVGEDKRMVGGVETVFHVLRDATPGSTAPVSAFVEKIEGKGSPKVYLVYPAIAGEMKVGPVGQPVVI